MKKKIESYQGAAGGWGAVKSVANAVRKQMDIRQDVIAMFDMNNLQCTNIQTVTVPVPAKFLRASNVPTGLLNEMIAYLNSEERNHHNFSELLLFSCLSIFAACKEESF